MRAIVYDRYGGPEVLRLARLPKPKFGQNSILVRTRAAGVNPADIALRSGAGSTFMEAWFPVVPGWDVAGVVEAVGAGVHNFAPGDEVLGYLHNDILHAGACAELVAGPCDRFVRKPSTLSWHDAAALPLASLTAAQALRALALTRDCSVLVLGAAGGVGSLAAQLAASQGHRVIGVASERGLQALRSRGVQAVARNAAAPEILRSLLPEGADAILDCAGKGSISKHASLIAGRTRVVSVADSGPGIRTVFARPLLQDLATLVARVAEGRVRPQVFAVFPLEQAANAQELVASGETSGRVVLSLD